MKLLLIEFSVDLLIKLLLKHILCIIVLQNKSLLKILGQRSS